MADSPAKQGNYNVGEPLKAELSAAQVGISATYVLVAPADTISAVGEDNGSVLGAGSEQPGLSLWTHGGENLPPMDCIVGEENPPSMYWTVDEESTAPTAESLEGTGSKMPTVPDLKMIEQLLVSEIDNGLQASFSDDFDTLMQRIDTRLKEQNAVMDNLLQRLSKAA